MKIKGYIIMYTFMTDDDGLCLYANQKEADKAHARMISAGANHVTDVEEVVLQLDSFEIREEA